MYPTLNWSFVEFSCYTKILAPKSNDNKGEGVSVCIVKSAEKKQYFTVVFTYTIYKEVVQNPAAFSQRMVLYKPSF